MTQVEKQKDKELLLKDLCARLPYRVIASCAEGTVMGIHWNKVKLDASLLFELQENGALIYVKPYLRPMSSMTEEEKKQFDKFMCLDEDAWIGKGIKGYINQSIIMSDGIDWLNAHHFDYRGLIEKGLAIEAPEGMYNIKE